MRLAFWSSVIWCIGGLRSVVLAGAGGGVLQHGDVLKRLCVRTDGFILWLNTWCGEASVGGQCQLWDLPALPPLLLQQAAAPGAQQAFLTSARTLSPCTFTPLAWQTVPGHTTPFQTTVILLGSQTTLVQNFFPQPVLYSCQ